MPKIEVTVYRRRFFFCPNIWIRRKVCKYREGICFCCGKEKRLEKSAVFFSDRCNSHFSDKLNRWVYDFNDYVWICRDCMGKGEPDKRLKMTSGDWKKAQDFTYVYPGVN